MKTEILKIKGDWEEVVNDCRATVGKDELGKEPSETFKRGILVAEHSPIRDLIVRWRWASIKSWVATHWSRHKWDCFIQTQRSDRTGVERNDLPQGAEVSFRGEANAQHLIDTWKKRLCYQASKETREYAEDFKATLHEVQPELSDVLVPPCVYRCGCPEMQMCKERHWTNFLIYCNKHGIDVTHYSIQNRYAMYNRYFRDRINGGKHESAKT